MEIIRRKIRLSENPNQEILAHKDARPTSRKGRQLCISQSCARQDITFEEYFVIFCKMSKKLDTCVNWPQN